MVSAKLYRRIVLLTALLGVFALGLSLLIERLTFWSSFLQNLSTELFGAALIIFALDMTIYLQAETDHRKRQSTAFAQLRQQLNRQLEVFVRFFVETLTELPPTWPSSLEELFTPEYFGAIRSFDATKPSPSLLHNDWYAHFEEVYKAWEAAIDQMIDKYGAVLSHKQIDLLEKIKQADYIRVTLWALEARHKAKNVDLADGAYFAAEETVAAAREYIDLLATLIAEFNAVVGDNPITLSASSFTKIADRLGASRLDSPNPALWSDRW